MVLGVSWVIGIILQNIIGINSEIHPQRRHNIIERVSHHPASRGAARVLKTLISIYILVYVTRNWLFCFYFKHRVTWHLHIATI